MAKKKNAVIMNDIKGFSVVKVRGVVGRKDQTTARLGCYRPRQKITTLLEGDTSLNEIFGLATSVVGIGSQTALSLMIFTEAFTLFDTPRKLCCYAGVAPFGYSPGTSIKGKTRVSKMANTTLKTALHMASLTAVKLDLQLKKYYERKVAEGKSKMSVLNAVKAKLIYRVMAVVKRKVKYENSLNFSLVLS